MPALSASGAGPTKFREVGHINTRQKNTIIHGDSLALVSAQKTGRQVIGVEPDDKYFEKERRHFGEVVK